MNVLTDAIREHHRALSQTLEAHARGVGGGEPQTARDAFVAFLKGDLLPHANSEERHLYGLVDGLVKNHGRPTATMIVDHESIGEYVGKIERTTKQLAGATSGDRARLLRELRDLALRLDAIVDLHLAKEERIYLPLIEEHADEARQREVLAAIHSSYAKERRDG